MANPRAAFRTVVALTAFAIVSAACQGSSGPGDGPTSRTPSPSPLTGRATPVAAPDIVDASVFQTRWPIKHVVFLIKENRTFDNLFGTFPGADGVRFGWDHGVRRPLVRGTDGRTDSDIPHCYTCALAAWDGGKMDGFDQSESADRWAYTQLHKDQLPNYWHWARDFVLADNFFASAQGPSFPNHLYTIAAQSGGSHDNPIQDLDLLKERHRETGLFKPWGCDSLKDAYVPVTDSEGV